jgi:hypothetical protein
VRAASLKAPKFLQHNHLRSGLFAATLFRYLVTQRVTRRRSDDMESKWHASFFSCFSPISTCTCITQPFTTLILGRTLYTNSPTFCFRLFRNLLYSLSIWPNHVARREPYPQWFLILQFRSMQSFLSYILHRLGRQIFISTPLKSRLIVHFLGYRCSFRSRWRSSVC